LEVHFSSFQNVSKERLKLVPTVLSARQAGDCSVSYLESKSMTHDQAAARRLSISTIRQLLGRRLHHRRADALSRESERSPPSITLSKVLLRWTGRQDQSLGIVPSRSKKIHDQAREAHAIFSRR
jgi:hypothetical protein